MLVSKAVSFHPGGLTFLDEFVPPRRATYFLAGLGLGPGRGREAAELARDLSCPTGASAELARLLEDRLLARRLLAQQGCVPVPATLAFTYKPLGLLQGGEASPGLRLVELSGKEGQEALVREEVGAFLRSEALGDALQVTDYCTPPREGSWRCYQVLWATRPRSPPLCHSPQFTHEHMAPCRSPFPSLSAAGGCEAQWLALAGTTAPASAPSGGSGNGGRHRAGPAGEIRGGGGGAGGGHMSASSPALPW